MGTYAGFFLPSILIPIFTLWAYYLSFLKYSLEALELNEWGNCASYYMASQFLSLDMTLNRWTNILILMVYPIAFHVAAVLSSTARTGELSRCCKRRRAGNSAGTTTKQAKSMLTKQAQADDPMTEDGERPAKPEEQRPDVADPNAGSIQLA